MNEGASATTTTWQLRLSAADAPPPASILLEVAGFTGIPTVRGSGSPFSRVLVESSTARVVLAGDLGDRELLEVHGTVPGTPPSAQVVEAAAGSTGGYARIDPAHVTLEWVAVD